MDYPRVLTRRPHQLGSQPRKRLVERVEGQAVVVLVGPAGSGKSVLAGQLVDESERRCVWVRMAHGAESSEALVGLVNQAVGHPELAPEDYLEQAGVLLDLLDESPTTLVIDDYHFAEAMSCDAVLSEVAQYMPSESQLVVLSRTRPAGFIGRAGSELATVIDGQALAFTSDEAKEFLGDAGLDWWDSTNGWAAAMGLAAQSGDASVAFEDLVRRVFVDDLAEELTQAVEALAVLPYINEALASHLDQVDAAKMQFLAQSSSLVSEGEGFWSISEAAAAVLLQQVSPERRRAIASAAADVLVASDPVTAIELLLDYKCFGQAVDLITGALGDIALEHAVRWVYRLPAELRHKLPPVLTGARATVDLDLAFVEAERRLSDASSPEQRIHALLGLGSVHAGRGELSLAADLLESALRSSAAETDVTPRIATELARVRWLSGDRTGATAALGEAEEFSISFWIQGMLALVDGDLDQLKTVAHAALNGEAQVVGRSLLALSAALAGDLAQAAVEADAAYQQGLRVGGHDLGCATVVMGLVLIENSRFDQLPIFLDQLERKVGRRETSFRAFAASLRHVAGVVSGDAELERLTRRVADFQKLGYREIDEIVRSFREQINGSSTPGLAVQLLGEFRVEVDGVAVVGDSWRTNKAKEVLALLAWHAPSGLRREQAIEYVWPSQEPEKGRTRLRTALSEIRRVLEPNRVAGQQSRFVRAQGDRVSIEADCDVARAAVAFDAGETAACFELLRAGLAPELPDADWVEDLASVVTRQFTEVAEKLSLDGSNDEKVAALRILVEIEPWQRSHIDRLSEMLRSAGDEAAANAVERKWFEDD